MPVPDREDRAWGALLGLALGDAVGVPALFHRTVLLPPAYRARLWSLGPAADDSRVLRFAMPYTISQPAETLDLAGTDDTEFAAAAARILLECGDDPAPQRLFDGWRRQVVDREEQVWSGVSERASIENARKGLRPPATGSDNPQYYDDGAVGRAVPVGIRHPGRPAAAAAVAGDLASITNAADGVTAARAMAAAVSVAVAGAGPDEAVDAGLAEIPPDSWLGRCLARALAILDDAGSGFAAVPRWDAEVVTRTFNYGNAAPETLSLAFAITRATAGRLPDAVQLAMLLPKPSDSMPALAGALSGALSGAGALPETWRGLLDPLRGVCLPHLRGQSLRALALALLPGCPERA